MSFLKNNKGEGRMGLFITIIIILLVFYLSYKIIPVKYNMAVFHDYLDDQTKEVALNRSLEASKIIENILNKARNLDLPVHQKDVKVDKHSSMITITVNYTVPVELPGYTLKFNGDERIERPLF